MHNEVSSYKVVDELVSTPAIALQRVRKSNTHELLLLKKFYHVQPDKIKSVKLSVGFVQETKWKTVLVPEEFVESDDSIAILYENMDGYCLREYMSKFGKLQANECIPLAIALANMVQHFHATGWIIKNLHPENVMITTSFSECRIIDAHKATNAYKNEVKLSLTSSDSGLPYISPEQTGLLNRITDYRSDFYSLGIILYELLTGMPPFRNKDLMALIHAHVAVLPLAPSSVNQYIPEMVSRIVMKLLAKNAENRYQSIQGLIYDLEQSKFVAPGESFVLGTKDEAGRITITDRLIGRPEELAVLSDAMLLAANGNKQVVYIRGYSGVGKTRLVEELQHRRLGENQRMVTAKFDVLQRNLPYSALIIAMKELVRELLKEDENGKAYWLQRLLQLLNGNGQIIINALPELKLLIGEQPEVKPLPPEETQSRFEQTIISFLEAFVTDGHFLCIFLDDLQWADIASVKLIELVVLQERIKNLLFIGAYRDNEVDFTHLMAISIKKQEQWISLKDIFLHPLKQQDTAELITGSLQDRVNRPLELAELVYQRTGGNAFYILQLLTALHEAKALQLTASGYWEWNDKAAQLQDVNQTVADLLYKKVSSLSDPLKELLKYAACLGDVFDLKTIAHLAKQKMNLVAWDLSTFINISYIISLDDNFENCLRTSIDTENDALENAGKTRFRFAHDQIRQAALTLVEPDEQIRLNLEAGKFKLASLTREELADELFYIANNLNAGASLLTDKEDIIQLVDINLQAGIKAKDSSAYESAMSYFNAGKSYLNFDEHYTMLYRFYLEGAICKYITGRYDEAEKELDFLYEKATSRMDKLNILVQKVYLYSTQDLKVKAVETGRLGYRLFKYRMPRKKWEVMGSLMIDLLKARFRLTDKAIEKLADLPMIKDKEIELFLEFTSSLAPQLYQYDQTLFVWNSMKMLMYSLKYGNNGVATSAYLCYAIVISQMFSQYRKGKQLADKAIELNNVLEFTSPKWKVLFAYYNLVQHWTQPVRPELDRILEVANGSYANGDPIFAGYSVVIYHKKKYALGFSLPELQQSFEEYLKFLERKQDIENIHYLRSDYQAILCLRGVETDSLLLGKNFNAPETINRHIASCSYSIAADAYISYMGILYLFGHFEEAYRQYILSSQYMSFAESRYVYAEYNFYGALICAKAAEQKSAPSSKLLKSMQSHADKLRIWKNNCAENFEPQYLLVNAVLETIKNKKANTFLLYEQAIASAGKHLFINIKAIACELAGEHAYQTGNQMMARTYLDNARLCYLQWGAVAKMQDIEKRYAALLGKSIMLEEEESQSAFSSQSADMLLLLQTAQTVKSEKDVDSLIQQLMKSVIQYAGADTGYLLIYNRSDFIVKAQYDITGGVRSVTAYPDGNMVPLTIIRNVTQLKQPLIINNPSQHSEYCNLAYFSVKHPRSVLCYPVLKQGMLFGLLYLENYSTEDVFSGEKLNMLHLISSQMAVLLDNAYINENMEVLIKERVSEIETKMDMSEALLRSVLPREAIQELKATGRTTAQKFNGISVLIADIKGFTLISERLTPEELITKIDLYFRTFDGIMTKCGLEKIKTIGDAYMAVGGLGSDPVKGAVATINASIAMQEFVKEQSMHDRPDQQLALRIGIHTGTVIAGVVGSHKLQYDIWGDTVNVAARMEQHSEPGRINVSKTTNELTASEFYFTYRGKIDAKNKGELDMFFVERAV